MAPRLVGKKLTEIWALVASNLPAALAKYGHLLSGPLAWLATFAGGLAVGELSFVLSFAIAAVLIVYGKEAATFAHRLLDTRHRQQRARGATGHADRSHDPRRGARRGWRGSDPVIAVRPGLLRHRNSGSRPLDAYCAHAGYHAGAADFADAACRRLCLHSEATQPAVIFLIWNIVVGLSDNILRPLMLGRGLNVPMPVILMGVIGGMIVDGLLGLFVGPVLLAVSYVLLLEWLQQHPV